MNIFGDDLFKEMFDFNKDGELDFAERLYRDAFIVNELLPQEQKEKSGNNNSYTETDDD